MPVAIPHKNRDFVAIPRDQYEEFLAWQGKFYSIKTAKPTSAEKKIIQQGQKAIKKGNYVEWSRVKKELDL